MKYCPQCGIGNTDQTQFCKNCGFQFRLVVSERHKLTNRRSGEKLKFNLPWFKRVDTRSNIVITSIIFAIIIIGLTFILLLERTDDPSLNSNAVQNVEQSNPLANPPEEKQIATEIEETKPLSNNDSENSEQKIISKQIVNADPNTSDKNKIKPSTERTFPKFLTIKEYFSYMSDINIAFSDKTYIKNKYIRENFTSGEFIVKIKGNNGNLVGQIKIDDLSDELRQTNSKIKVADITRDANNKITDLTITYL